MIIEQFWNIQNYLHRENLETAPPFVNGCVNMLCVLINKNNCIAIYFVVTKIVLPNSIFFGI